MTEASASRRALVGALMVAALGAVLFVLYLQRFEQEKSGGEPVKVLVVTKAIARGKLVTDEALSVRDIPTAYVDSHAIRASEREKVIGLRTIAPLEAQNVLMWNDLAVAVDERRDLSTLVTPGFRAVTLRASRDDLGLGLINPGDYVDVIATVPRGDHGDRTASVVLLQKALVLASGGRTSAAPPPADEKSHSQPQAREQALTLSLSLQQAQLVAVAAEHGHFSVAVRSVEDPRTFDGIAEIGENALLEAPQAQPGAHAALRAAVPIRLRDTPVAPPGLLP